LRESWLEAETYDYVLRAHEEMIVKVRMRIPKGFNRSSARACLLVTSKPEKRADKKGPRLNIELRYAVNVLYRNPAVPPGGRYGGKSFSGRGGQQGLGIALSKCRKRRPNHFLPSTFIERPGEVVYQTESLHAKGLIPNQCRTVQFNKPDLPAGNYQMVVVSQTDAGEKFGVTHSLKL
jgi:hypothetical protein